MTNDTARILASGLEAMEQLGLSPEECLARHPDQRMALSDLLRLAQALRSTPSVMPSLDFRIDARRRLLAQLSTRRSRHMTPLVRPALLVRAALMLLLLAAWTTSVATTSAQALPNDILYPMKRTIEQIRLTFATDAVHRSKLRLAFANERLKEMERLIDLGRGDDAPVALEDFVSQIQSVVSIAQTMPDTTERAVLMARVAESITSSDVVLSATQVRLPESAQVAVTRARAILAERQDDLRRALPTAVSITPVGAALDRPATPTLPRTSPTAIPAISTLRPAWIGQPAELPAHEPASRPTQPPGVWPPQQPSRATSVPRVIPTYVPPIAVPTSIPYSVPPIKLFHFLTPIARLVWPKPGHQR